MKKNIFAVCDLEASYAVNLTDYLNERKMTPFEVQAFTNVESLVRYGKTHPMEILLISARAICNEVKELPINKIIILSEGESLESLNLEEYPSVYKYQSSDSLVAEVMEYYAASGQTAHVVPDFHRRTRLIGVYSPLSRCRRTSFALTMGEVLAETKHVLYINMEKFSGFEKLMGMSYRMDLSDVFYFYRQHDGNLIYRWPSIVQTFHNLVYIPPVSVPTDLEEIDIEEWRGLIKEITTTMEYDTIVLDIGSGMQNVPELLELCDHIYMPVRDDLFSAAKLAHFDSFMERTMDENFQEKITRVHPPAQVLLREGRDLVQQLVWGEMGNFVRMLLWEDGQ